MFSGFNPAVSKNALKKMSERVRSWRLHLRTDLSESDIARWINPVVRGWMQYYGAFYRSELYPLLGRINSYLMRWMRKKYERLRKRKPTGHGNRPWPHGPGSSPTGPGSRQYRESGEQNDRSRITGDRYVRICEGRGVRFPRLLGGLEATRRCAAVVELLAQVEHACGSCPMSPGLAASRVTWSRGCGL